MKNNHLLGIEALLRNSHELAVGAREAAAEARDTVTQHRLAGLAKQLKDELTIVRQTIRATNRSISR